MQPVLQVALDFVDLERALRLAAEAVAGGADWLEAGTPLIKSEGLDCVRELRRVFPEVTLVADMKIMDVGRVEVEIAAKAGADVVVALAAASDSTIAECVEAGRAYGIRVAADLLGVADPVARAVELEALGVSHIGYHTPIDEQMRGETPFLSLREIAQAVRIPLAVAGGVNSQTAALAVDAGADIVIVGGAINKAPDARKATEEIKRAITERVQVRSERYVRADADDLREHLARIPTADLSGGNQDWPAICGLIQVCPGVKMVGTAFTVRSLPGDWSKPVQAIDHARPGDVLVIDACGLPPAVWGEMATMSAQLKGLAGIVLHGAIRDVADIRKMAFPAYASLICPNAGKPKGYGEMGGAVEILGHTVRPGDWIVGDDDGIIALPKERAVEMANRGMNCLEAEERVIQEILGGRTLAEIAEIAKWDKAR